MMAGQKGVFWAPGFSCLIGLRAWQTLVGCASSPVLFTISDSPNECMYGSLRGIPGNRLATGIPTATAARDFVKTGVTQQGVEP
jgi:hypothetical protein